MQAKQVIKFPEHKDYATGNQAEGWFKAEMRANERKIRECAKPLLEKGYRVEELTLIQDKRIQIMGVRIEHRQKWYTLWVRTAYRWFVAYHPEWNRDEDGMPLGKA